MERRAGATGGATMFKPNPTRGPHQRPDTPPSPSRQHYETLGVADGAPVATCVEAFDRRVSFYDPRRHPADRATQCRMIGHIDALDTALSLIVDAERWKGRAA